MSYETKADARAEAARVRKRMRAPARWGIVVWENLGWHWRLQCDGMSLYENRYLSRKTRYKTLLSREAGESGGDVNWTPDGFPEFFDPQAAVDHQLELANEFVESLVEDMRRISESLGRRDR